MVTGKVKKRDKRVEKNRKVKKRDQNMALNLLRYDHRDK